MLMQNKINYFYSVIYYSIFSSIIFLLFFSFLKYVSFMDSMSFLLSILSLIIGLFMMMVGKIYELNYFWFIMKLWFFLSMSLLMYFSFYSGSFILFYILFELSVIPIFMYIMIWGSSFDKIKASFFLFFYTYFSSLIFLVCLLKFYSNVKSMSFLFMKNTIFFSLNLNLVFILFLMIVVFLVKMPVFFFHIWLPLAHVESPLVGSMLLASLMLKLGGYGIIRLLEMFYFSFNFFNNYLIMIGIWGSFMAGIFCLSQYDLKKMVAFSSISHMTLMLGAIFSFSLIGKFGSIIMMVGHGFSSSAMFLGLGVLYYRYFSRNYFLLGSILIVLPMFGLWWFIFCIMNMSFPPFFGFMSELLIFFSYILISNIFYLLSIMVIMVVSFYTVMLMVYIISGLESKIEMSDELNISENLILYLHSFFLFMSLFFYWMF